MAARDELEKQLKSIFGRAHYPVKNVMDLLPVLPQGPMTRFQVGTKTITAMDLSQKLAGRARFPYQNADALVQDILAGLQDAGMI
jgi:hypothetical protein